MAYNPYGNQSNYQDNWAQQGPQAQNNGYGGGWNNQDISGMSGYNQNNTQAQNSFQQNFGQAQAQNSFQTAQGGATGYNSQSPSGTGGYRGVAGAAQNNNMSTMQTGGLRSAPTNGYSDVNTTYLPRGGNNASPYAMTNSLPPGWGVSKDQGPMSPNPNYGQSQPAAQTNVSQLPGGQKPLSPQQAQQQQQQQQGWGSQPANSDFQNADGSWHYNPQYGQDNNSGGGGGGGNRSNPWGQYPGNAQFPQGNSASYNGANGIGGRGNGAPDYSTFLPTSWITGDNKTALKNTAQFQLPIMQFLQNQSQYNNDFEEAARRFNLQYGDTHQAQMYQQGLSDRQQQLAEWQAQQGGAQWQSQFDQQKANDAWNQQFQTNKNQQDYMLATNQQQYGQQNFNANLDFQKLQNQQQFGLQNQQMTLQEAAQQNQRDQWLKQFAQQQGNDLRNYGLQQQQMGLNTRGMTLQELQNTQQFGLQNQQLDLAKLQNEQKYGLDTRGMTVQEAAQAAQAAYQQGQLGQGNRSLDLQQAQQAQQAQQFAQQLAQQKEAAYLQAYGHNQKPSARWMKAT